MNRFEDLPINVKALLLAKLAIELTTHRCTNLHELARKHDTDITTVWRNICRLSKQPVCSVPQAGLALH